MPSERAAAGGDVSDDSTWSNNTKAIPAFDLAALDRVAAEMRAMPPFPTKIEAPSEVIAAMDRALADGPPPIEGPRVLGTWPSIAGWLPIERDDDLPAWSYRVHMSDGTTTVEKLERR